MYEGEIISEVDETDAKEAPPHEAEERDIIFSTPLDLIKYPNTHHSYLLKLNPFANSAILMVTLNGDTSFDIHPVSASLAVGNYS